MRRVSMKQIKEVLKLKYQMDFSFRRISKSVGISASTALEYCRRFEILKDKLEDFILLDEYVDENNPVRAIDSYVDSIDLATLGVSVFWDSFSRKLRKLLLDRVRVFKAIC